jgi:hypothetical protein
VNANRAAREIEKDIRARAYMRAVHAEWLEQDIASGAAPVSLEEASQRYRRGGAQSVKNEDKRIPRSFTPLASLVRSVAFLFDDRGNHAIYNFGEQEFVALVMEESGGAISPDRTRQMYKDLMDDAGLEPLP